MSMMVPNMVHYFVVRHSRKRCEDVVVDVDATRVTHRGNDTLSTLEHQPATPTCGGVFAKIVCDFTNVGPRKLPVNHRRKIEFPERMEL